jgi:hypothetical protein
VKTLSDPGANTIDRNLVETTVARHADRCS